MAHPAPQVDRIARSLATFGQGRSIVVWHTTIIAGHGVVAAARQLGWTHIHADVLDPAMPEQTALAYLVADNELSRLADPDQAALAALLQELGAGDDALLAAMGYDAGELEQLLQAVTPAGTGDAEPQVDRAEELRVKWGVEPGQLWALGEHRLICGDCTDAATVARVMGGEKADMVFTSPPYNRGTTTGGGFNAGGLSQQLIDSYSDYADDRTVKDYRDWQSSLLLSWWKLLADNGAIFYNHRPRVQNGIYETPLEWNPGLPIRQIVIWHSGAGINFAPTHYRVSHEWIVIYAIPAFRLSSKGDSGIGDVWQFGATRIDGHPAPFTVDLPITALKTTTCAIVFDPFSGSGTTLIACQNLARRCRAIEISPAYCAVTLQRFTDAFPALPPPTLLEPPHA